MLAQGFSRAYNFLIEEVVYFSYKFIDINIYESGQKILTYLYEFSLIEDRNQAINYNG